MMSNILPVCCRLNLRSNGAPFALRCNRGICYIVRYSGMSLLLLLATVLLSGRAAAQTNSGGGQRTVSAWVSPADAPADVVIFVKPLAPDTASMGVAYNERVSHALVRKHLARLLAATGWQAESDLQIQDASVHPDRLKQYPVTTGAMVTLLQAPKVQDGAPELRPYLQAYQQFGHVEVVFVMDPITSYRGIDRFTSKAVTVELERDAGEGVYRYDAAINDHSGPLPALVPTLDTAPPLATSTPVKGAQPIRHAGSLPGILMAAGLALLVGAGVYWTVLRRTPTNRGSWLVKTRGS